MLQTDIPNLRPIDIISERITACSIDLFLWGLAIREKVIFQRSCEHTRLLVDDGEIAAIDFDIIVINVDIVQCYLPLEIIEAL